MSNGTNNAAMGRPKSQIQLTKQRVIQRSKWKRDDVIVGAFAGRACFPVGLAAMFLVDVVIQQSDDWSVETLLSYTTSSTGERISCRSGLRTYRTCLLPYYLPIVSHPNSVQCRDVVLASWTERTVRTWTIVPVPVTSTTPS